MHRSPVQSRLAALFCCPEPIITITHFLEAMHYPRENEASARGMTVIIPVPIPDRADGEKCIEKAGQFLSS